MSVGNSWRIVWHLLPTIQNRWKGQRVAGERWGRSHWEVKSQGCRYEWWLANWKGCVRGWLIVQVCLARQLRRSHTNHWDELGRWHQWLCKKSSSCTWEVRTLWLRSWRCVWLSHRFTTSHRYRSRTLSIGLHPIEPFRQGYWLNAQTLLLRRREALKEALRCHLHTDPCNQPEREWLFQPVHRRCPTCDDQLRGRQWG